MSMGMFLGLLGGLALFLYGMQMMSVNLEAAIGNRMKHILERLAANRLLGVCVGVGTTAATQSFSATMVVVVGFVNSGFMMFRQAVWIIMGANIGITVTGQLTALDIGELAPFITLIGVALALLVRRRQTQFAGGIIAGLGILFIGMGMMEEAMVPLCESKAFVNLVTRFSNSLLGVLAGAVFTVIIQSSSASVGILQALTVSGLIGLDNTVFVLFGQNIGTCITATPVSIGASRDAKRATLIHLLFNVIGAAIFTAVCIIWPFIGLVGSSTPYNPAAQIANMYTLLNIVTTLLLPPFGAQLAQLAGRLPSGKAMGKVEEERWFEDLLESEHVPRVLVIARKQLKGDVGRMLSLAAGNVNKGFLAFGDRDETELEKILEWEEEIDLLNARLSWKISKVLQVEYFLVEVEALRHIFTVIGNIECTGDHAKSLAGYAKSMMDRKLELPDQAPDESVGMRQSCRRALRLSCNADYIALGYPAEEAALLEQEIDDKVVLYWLNQMERTGVGTCHVETSILYLEILADFERIGDHVLNIARAWVSLEETDRLLVSEKEKL